MANHFDRHYCGKCGLTYVYQNQGEHYLDITSPPTLCLTGLQQQSLVEHSAKRNFGAFAAAQSTISHDLIC
ncbi:Ubiquitin-40S ribosomal protein S27a-3 [Ananas comosus]|uniref:Ubiquitin-40S ribosomal protein S27a-3 n=1 Tax=Ananas comosus TaxID=4615 RepID=A0A199UWZ0_ANACO|nr:Ubiquitin-40S ribosomal protein S27a-3 [Ananas comosus]